eukprot:TRINITY_DN24310_c0_g1_i3.p1 TRINITY_DN24310_c0_g1~~TRINITY_DN24310_c0_g1_i3.p1  ORF type:complete len:135 (+),score=29.86 TRINITY_DN24310_c0_g1_i3:275-679(+)
MTSARPVDQATYQEVLIAAIIGAVTALMLLFIDRWRKTLNEKRKKNLVNNLEMRTHTGKHLVEAIAQRIWAGVEQSRTRLHSFMESVCLLYTSDAADEEDSVDLGGRRIIKKKKKKEKKTRRQRSKSKIEDGQK